MSRNITVKSALSRRYAAALFALAQNAGSEDAVARDLAEINAMVAASPALAKLLRSPVVPYARLEQALAELFGRAGISELTCRFCDVLGKNGRLALLPQVYRAYAELLSAQRGEIKAEVASAAPLPEGDLEKIGALLSAATRRRVSVQEKVNPGILGGLVVKFGSRMLDASLAGKLEQMRSAMKSG